MLAWIFDVLTGDNELVGNCWARNLLSPSWQESILNKCCLIYLSLKRLMYVPIEIIAYSNVAYISNILYPIPLTQREQFLWFTESAWKFQYLIEPTALNWKCNIFTKTCLLVLRSRLRGDSKCCSPVSDFAWFIPPWTEYFRKLLPLLAFPWWALGKYESGFKQYFTFLLLKQPYLGHRGTDSELTIEWSRWCGDLFITSNILPEQVRGYKTYIINALEV